MAQNFELTRIFLDSLRDLIRQEETNQISALMTELHPADIAQILEQLNLDEAIFLYLRLAKEMAADVLVELEEDDRDKLLANLPSETIAKDIINQMESDDAADLIADLSEEKRAEVLQNIDDVEQAVDIVDLLNYDEDTAGGLMAKELIKVNINWDINTCIKEMRKQASEVEEMYYVYVIDDDGMLKGTVSLKRLMLARSNAKIKNIYKADIISVNTATPSEEVAMVMEKYDLVAIPVVDAIGRLMGRITIDDVVDVIREEAGKDYQMASGITEDVEPSDDVFMLIRARVPWLFIGMIGGIMGAQIIGSYEDQLKIHPQLAVFLPLIAAMGGNVGVQSSSIVVQGLANKSLDLDSTGRKLIKELSVAFLTASIFSILILLYNLISQTSMAMTITVSVALFSVMIFASVFGSFVPIILNRFKIDPAIATGPFITTSNDILGIFLYMAIGHWIFTVFL